MVPSDLGKPNSFSPPSTVTASRRKPELNPAEKVILMKSAQTTKN